MPLSAYQRRQMYMRRRTGRTAAQDAAQAGDEALVQDYLAAGYPPEQLWAAALYGRRNSTTLIETLLSEGVPVDTAVDQGRTALMVAAKDGDLPLAQRLILAGAEVNATSLNGETPLSEAALGRHPAMLRWLLDQGARPNPVDLDTPVWTALHWAADYAFSRPGLGASPNPKVMAQGLMSVRLLLDAGADPNVENPNGDTPFIMALRSAVDTPGVEDALQRMLANGANINRSSQGGSSHQTPLGAVMGLYFQKERFDWLLAQGPDLTRPSSYDRLPLFNAMESGSFIHDENQVYSARRLLEAGADPHQRWGAHEPAFNAFLKRWAARGEQSPQTPVGFRDKALWQAMVNHPKFRVDAVDEHGRTPLMTLLLDGAWGPTHLELMVRLLKLGADLNAQDEHGQTPLLLASGRSWAAHQAQDANDLLNWLLDHRADPQLGQHWSPTDPHRTGRSVLHLLVRWNSLTGPVQRLLNAGLSPDLQDVWGNTPLHLAMRNDATSTARLLIDHGAAVDVRNKDDELPFQGIPPFKTSPEAQRLAAELLARYEQKALHTIVHDEPVDVAPKARARL